MKRNYTGNISENDSLARGLHAGNFDNAYVSENFATAWAKRQDPAQEAHPALYRAAYIIGFYGSYEKHEIPASMRKAAAAAHQKAGARLRALGFAI